MSQMKDLSRHPCFNKESAGDCGRAHLPVAPKCNIKCNYCNRKYDCVNESRPGVASAVLSPAQAALYMDEILLKEPRITVAGIAGPGDPMANALETLRTMRLIREKHPNLLFCLSSNGLALPPYLDDLADAGVSHVTVTMNAVDPDIGAKIYSFVRDGNVVYRGRDAAALLLSRQLEAVEGLKKRGLIVKINTIILPGINDDHIPEVAKALSSYGVDIMNLIPVHPTADTPFADIVEPDKATIHGLRRICGEMIPQMTHCRRCRADAVGLLCSDRSRELAPTLTRLSKTVLSEEAARPYVAVASREGMLINQHLGEAKAFYIFEMRDGELVQVEERNAPTPGCGPKRWEDLARLLGDCRAILAGACGETPRKILEGSGLKIHECSGFIEPAVRGVYESSDMSAFGGRKRGIAAACCSGGGGKGCI